MGVDNILTQFVGGESGDDSYDDQEDSMPVSPDMKPPSAQDFTDITEVAEDDESAPRASDTTRGHGQSSSSHELARLYQLGMTYAARSQTGTALGQREDEEEDYDADVEEGQSSSSVSLPAVSTSPLPGQPHSLPLSLDSGLGSESQTASFPTSITPGGTPEDELASCHDTGAILLSTEGATSVPVSSRQDTAIAISGAGAGSSDFPGYDLSHYGEPPVVGPSSIPSIQTHTEPYSDSIQVLSEGQIPVQNGSNSTPDSLPEPQAMEVDGATEPPVQQGPAIPALIPEDMTLEQLHRKVKELFPGFKSEGILRFSSMLGPGRTSSMPRIWEGAKKPKKRRRAEGEERKPLQLEFGSPPPLEMCMSDDEDKLMASVTTAHGRPGAGSQSSARHDSLDPETQEWRFGPAKVWYDMIGVPEDGRDFDYGFKLKEPSSVDKSESNESPPSLADQYVPPDDAFLMVTQQHWEDKILWDVPYTPGPAITGSGGVWSTSDSASNSSLSQLLSSAARQQSTGSTPLPTGGSGQGGAGSSTHSMFPIENYDLVYKRWEDDIIWDSDAVTHLPKPSVARLDPNDPNLILGYPAEPVASAPTDKDGKKDLRKTSKFLMNKMNRAEAPQSSFLAKKEPFNLSNDEYYNPQHASSTQGLSGFDSNVVQHSIPALDLHLPWYPTHLSTNNLRNFHRPKLRFRCERGEETTGFYPITCLVKHITRKEKEREKERVTSGGGEVFFMRSPEDLSACDGHVVLAEYSEQYPSLLMATGMATKIKNYYRRPERQVKSHAPELVYGETTYIQTTSYFLGQLKPGQTLQSFENNIFRAPIYLHQVPSTDFLIIVSESGDVHIRDVRDIFLVGQECPKVEVPAPNSKAAMQFQKDYLQVYLYRLFRDSGESPKKIKMETVRKAFPPSDISESVIRKVLKLCADFKREGYEISSRWWVLRHDFRLPTDEEVRLIVTPEQFCANASMLAAGQRLKDAGYRGKSLFTVEEEEDESSHKIDDEIRSAPWNTTHHFISATKGKYQLSVNGPSDPTGCGEGFSYTRLNPRQKDGPSSALASRKYKAVMGTDGDLRKLKLPKARNVLRNFGVPEEEISKLSRWAVIDMVRALSTEAAKMGGVDAKNLKFARGARFSQMEAQERYKEECQRIFDLQNKVLGSAEPLSTDEESSSSGGESDDELGRNLETLLGGKKTSAQLSHEQEEAERQELRRLLNEDKPLMGRGVDTPTGDMSGRGTPSGDGDDTSSVRSFSSMVGKRLLISRTFCDEEGREYVRHEVVKNQAVIDAYIRVKTSPREKDIMSQFASRDEQTREDMKKEKRRIQDQLRRIKKLEEKVKKKSSRPPKQKPLTTINMKCSACGQRGHMKTNKNCPMYKNNPVQVAPTDEEVAQHEASLSQDDLVKVEGTKVVLNKAVVEHALDVRRKSLLLKFPKEKLRKKRRYGDEELDYLEKRAKSVQRRRTNPEVPFSAALQKILQTLVSLPESQPFSKPVVAKVVPDYYSVIKFPMDLQTMREYCREHRYLSREEFWEHMNLIVNNCITYNGFNSDLTKNAQKLLEVCSAEMKKVEKELEQLEQEINPALDDDAQVALSFLLGKAIEAMKTVPDSWPFHVPVSAKKLPDYHKYIRRPMDLDTMLKNCNARRYTCQEHFLIDLSQIVENSITYNGPNSRFTRIAERMREVGLQTLAKESDLIGKLESRLGEMESSTTTTPFASPPGSVSEAGGRDMYELSQSQASGGSENAMVLLDSGAVASPVGGEVIDVEAWDEGGEGMDVLLQDLQHSSSSSESESEEEEEEGEGEERGGEREKEEEEEEEEEEVVVRVEDDEVEEDDDDDDDEDGGL